MKKTDFEFSLSRLDEIVKKLESGDCTLDESFALFEEGTALAKKCSDILEKAKSKLTVKEGETPEE